MLKSDTEKSGNTAGSSEKRKGERRGKSFLRIGPMNDLQLGLYLVDLLRMGGGAMHIEPLTAGNPKVEIILVEVEEAGQEENVTEMTFPDDKSRAAFVAAVLKKTLKKGELSYPYIKVFKEKINGHLRRKITNRRKVTAT